MPVGCLLYTFCTGEIKENEKCFESSQLCGNGHIYIPVEEMGLDHFMFVYVVCLGVCQPPLRSIPVFFLKLLFLPFHALPLFANGTRKEKKDEEKKKQSCVCLEMEANSLLFLYTKDEYAHAHRAAGEGKGL